MSAERVTGLTIGQLDAMIEQSCGLFMAVAHSYERGAVCRGNVLRKLHAYPILLLLISSSQHGLGEQEVKYHDHKRIGQSACHRIPPT